MKLPVVIMEEHGEAYRVWNLAAWRGEIPLFGNTLLHVDHHPDFEGGAYRTDWMAPQTARDFCRTAQWDIGIADFILPCVWRGLFNDVVFTADFSFAPYHRDDMVLTLEHDNVLLASPKSPLLRAALLREPERRRLFYYAKGGLAPLEVRQTCVLDIDLDYFCWDDSLSTAPEKRVEITEPAYRSLTSDPYHPFRILPRLLLDAVEKNGRYYLQYRERFPPDAIPRWDIVEKRIARLLGWLGKNRIAPRLIDLCRSERSGYMPGEMRGPVERALLKGLADLYGELQISQSREGWDADG